MGFPPTTINSYDDYKRSTRFLGQYARVKIKLSISYLKADKSDYR